MNSLIINNLSHSYNDVSESNLIFQDINLQINLSETFSLTGESGSGKSTFIHLVTGMLQPSLGSITVDNKKISSMKPKLKATNLSIVFQYHSLLENLNVLENISLPIKIFKGKLDKDDHIFLDQLLNSTNMMDKKLRYPHELSGGEKQRVSIIRSIALKPKCIFMDEPTGNLDNDTSLLIHELCIDIHKEWGIGIFLATHDMVFASKMNTNFNIKNKRIIAND